MFGYIKKTLGVVTVKQSETEIIVEGVPGYFIENDISNLWKTSKITAHMFNKITRNTFTIPLFFALDLLYTMEQLIASPRKVGISKNTAQKIIDGLYLNTWLADSQKEHASILDFDKLKLFYKTPLDFQYDFFNKYNKVLPKYKLKGYMLAGAAGSGKTYMGMALAEMREVDKVIVICPNNAVYKVWDNSIKTEYKKPPSHWIAADKKIYGNEKYLVFHYEALYKALEMVKGLHGKIMIILDESHNMNEITSQQTQNFIKLCKDSGSNDILWASGTPIKALGSESVPFFATIDPFFTEDIKEKFKKLFGKNAKKANDILSNRINLYSHKIEKSQLKLAEPIIANFPVKAPNGEEFTLDNVKKDMIAFIEQQQAYYAKNAQLYKDRYEKCLSVFEKTISSESIKKSFDLYKQYIKVVKTTELRDCKDEVMYCNKFENTEIMPVLSKELKAEFKEAKTVVKYVQLKIQGECLGRVLGKKRMQCILALSQNVDYAKYIESTVKKTLIFTSYVEVLSEAKKTVEALGFTPLVVYGKTNSELTSIISQFEKDPQINPLIATFKSLSTAVPLVMADTMIMLNSPFRDYIHQQAISRIHRLGSDTQVYVYIGYLDTGDKPNLSTRTIDILKWSQQQVEQIMNIKSPFEIEEVTYSAESINGRPVVDLDFIISMEELGIEEMFDSQADALEEAKVPVLAKW